MTATLLLGLMVPAMATPESAGQCAGDGTKVQGQGESTVDVDGTMVTATISDKSVAFTDGDGQPIDVTFCVKASDDNSGNRTGSSWTVQHENDGGQTPAISHVVLYGLTETADTDAATCPDAADMITDSGLAVTGEGGTATGTVTTDIPAGCDVTVTLVSYFASGDSWPSNLPQAYNEHVTETFTTSGDHSVGPVDVADCFYQVDLVRGDEVIHDLSEDNTYGPRKLEWDNGGSEECTEVLGEDETPDGDTETDGETDTDGDTDVEGDAGTPGTTVPPAADDDDETGVLADELTPGTAVPGADDDTEVIDTAVAVPDEAGGGSDQLAATGVPLLILVLMGLGALIAGTGVLTSARRR